MTFPPPLKGLVDDLGQGLGVALRRLVEAVAVGALHHHEVGLVDGLGIPDDGLVHVAQVPGEDDLPGDPLLGEPQLGAGRAQQVPGVGEPQPDPGAQVHHLAVLTGGHQLHGVLGVGQGVEGLHRRAARPAALLVLPLGVGLLDVGRVPEHDGHELSGQPGGHDPAVEALLLQQGDAAGVVDVGVGDDHIVDGAGGKVQHAVVPLVPALLKAAVNEDAGSVDLQAVAAPGDGLGRAVKSELHGAPPCFFFCLYSNPGRLPCKGGKGRFSLFPLRKKSGPRKPPWTGRCSKAGQPSTLRWNRAPGSPAKTTQPPSGRTAEVSPQATELAVTAPLAS